MNTPAQKSIKPEAKDGPVVEGGKVTVSESDKLNSEGTIPGFTGERYDVKTTGDFNLQDPFTLITIGAGETVEVVETQFIRDKLDSKELEKA